MIGQTLSHFEITAKLGEGGMGAVYRATDSSLGREVAIKVLPEGFADSSERLARFEREAKVLGALNHPHIAGIHEVGEAEVGGETVRFLAMELAEGEDLSDRLGRGRIPIDEALRLAQQIAEALEAAHEKGIVHRDLKPANVKITTDGQIKVLDFGLAKVWETPGGSSELSHSPTLTAQMTQVGTLLGTAAYMSPEQARGQEADRRSDVWAFGLLLTEMLSGRKTFQEDTVSDTLAAVLKSDPDLGALPTDLPPSALRLIERCLRKDPNERLRDMGDVGLELLEIAAHLGEPDQAVALPVATTPPAASRRWLMPVIAAAVGVAAALVAWSLLPQSTTPSTSSALVRFGVPAPPGTSFVRGIALSPDGRTLAMTLRNEAGHTEIWLRSMDSLEVRRLPDSEGGRFPFWAPDSQRLGFLAGYELRVADLMGTPVRLLARTSNAPDTRGGTWSQDGTIVYAPSWQGGLSRIPAAGGEPEPATELDPDLDIGTHRFPMFLPDGVHFVFYASTGSGMEPGQIRLAELGSTDSKLLTTASSAPTFAPPDRLIYALGDVLVAHRIDLDRFEMVGDPRPLGPSLPGGLAISGLRSLSASMQGELAFVVQDFSFTRLAWVTRDGEVLGSLGDNETWHYQPRISPDGESVVVSRYAADSRGGDVWLYDRARGLGKPLVAGDEEEDLAVWSPDGRRIAFTTTRSDGRTIRIVDVDNPTMVETVYETPESAYTSSWLRDGTTLVLDHMRNGNYDVSTISLDEPDQEPLLLLENDEIAEWDAEESPGGGWIAYTSEVTGSTEVWLRDLEGSAPAWQASTQGGRNPVWSADGKELFFVSTDDWLMSAEVTGSNPLRTAPPVRLFRAMVDVDQVDRQFDVGPDGVFLVNRRGDDATEPVNVILGLENLFEGNVDR